MSSSQDQPTRAEREWQRRHREILDAAREMFMADGYAGTTMQEIAERSEYSVGYIYRHFPGKQDLLDAILDEQIQVHRRIRHEVRSRDDLSPLQKFRHEIVLMSEHLLDHPGLVALFQGSIGLEPLRKIRFKEEMRLEDVELFQQAIDTGEIQSVDPALLVAACDGVIWGLVTMIHDSACPERFTELPRIVDDLILAPLSRNHPDLEPR